MMSLDQSKHFTDLPRTLVGAEMRRSEEHNDDNGKLTSSSTTSAMTNSVITSSPSSTHDHLFAAASSSSSLCRKNGITIDIIEAAADLLDPEDCQQEGIAVEPLPLGPRRVLRLVDAVPLAESNTLLFENSDIDREAFFKVLQPLLYVKAERTSIPGASTNGYNDTSGGLPARVLSSLASSANCSILNKGNDLASAGVPSSSRGKRRKSCLDTDKAETVSATNLADASTIEDSQYLTRCHGTADEHCLLMCTASGREGDDDQICFNKEEMVRFRSYQSDQWNDRFQDLIDFRNKHGHCLVPHNFPENPRLAQWTKRQRYQYKQKHLKQQSTLSTARQAALEKMGFVWDSHKAGWMEKFRVLKQFKSKYGHCTVPSNYIDHSLAVWVKCQRRQYKLYLRGVRSTMTRERYALLELMNFDWNPRNLK